ncbi:MBOAT family O-acyltransferase [Saccharicrinis aurantiacus]|uniref:MBOAT family O-acyltransferase n=1 Tax=Saccharicrinis aurantiacus TaxID=1849719 RepID=UPI002491C6C9|nr:MBOAT family O-acyltransferase [Saccharicrinis aurantiacus]
MLFNSIEFTIFLPIVFTLYWLLKSNIKAQNTLILLASYLFYGWWDWRFLSLIAFSTLVDYVAGLQIHKSEKHKHRRAWLQVSLLVNLGFLGFFKYYNFFADNLVEAFTFFGSPLNVDSLNIILPVGISFYTFQTLSYSIDIYRKKLEPTIDFIAFASYVSFFPQLVAGPIERAVHLLPQFRIERHISPKLLQTSLNFILIGIFKKVVVADRLAPYVDHVFTSYTDTLWLTIIIGIFFFAIQIYCDFSGYSDIAIGVARLFGFDLMLNFHSPYFANSFTSFWKRWHISLSTWFKDYLYIPLGGNRVSTIRHKTNLFITFLVSGLWHGANWTFIIWGATHGFMLVLENSITETNLSKKIKQNRLYSKLAIIPIFLMVCLTWVFFRAPNLCVATDILQRVFSPSLILNIPQLCAYLGPLNLALSLLVIGILFILDLKYPPIKIALSNVRYQNILTIALLLLIIFLGKNNEVAFIYFQF